MERSFRSFAEGFPTLRRITPDLPQIMPRLGIAEEMISRRTETVAGAREGRTGRAGLKVRGVWRRRWLLTVCYGQACPCAAQPLPILQHPLRHLARSSIAWARSWAARGVRWAGSASASRLAARAASCLATVSRWILRRHFQVQRDIRRNDPPTLNRLSMLTSKLPALMKTEHLVRSICNAGSFDWDGKRKKAAKRPW